MILTHCPFVVVCPPFNCNGDCKEEWHGVGTVGCGGEVKSNVGIRFNKCRM